MNSRRRQFKITSRAFPLVIWAYSSSIATIASGVWLKPGDILVADPDFVHATWTGVGIDIDPMRPAVWKIDAASGAREEITSKTRGEGAPLLSVTQIVLDGLGRMTISDPYGGALLRVDPVSGDRSRFSDFATAITVDADNSLIALNHLTQSIFRVDGESGEQTLISGPSRGSGVLLPYSALAVDRAGLIWAGVYDDLHSALMKIDPTTGNREIVSGFGNGQGPEFVADIKDLHVFDSDTAVAINRGTLCEVDLMTGDRSFITLHGPRIDTISALSRLLDGNFVATDETNGSVFRVDAVTGMTSLLSANTPGHEIWMPQDVFVVTVPEPNFRSQMIVAAIIVSSVFGRRVRY